MKQRKKIGRYVALGLSVTFVALSASCSLLNKNKDESIILKNTTTPKNVILLIGDGMGPNQIKAGELHKGEKLCMQGFPYQTKVETRSYSDSITDSAAAATALATGTRTINGYVGLDPYGRELETIVDIAAGLGKRTAVITTEEIYGATPMGFSGHSVSRSNSDLLLETAGASSNVNLLVSYSNSKTKNLVEAGYTQVPFVEELSEATAEKVVGSYVIKAEAPSMTADGYVAFDRVLTEALDYLAKDEDGFFMMAEGAHIDHGGHNNDIDYMLAELLAFDDGVRAVLEWADKRDDTVVIVTADHETGGLWLSEEVTSKNLLELDRFGASINYRWTTSGHSNTDVYCFINGADIDFAQYSFGTADRIQNTDIFLIMKSLLGVK